MLAHEMAHARLVNRGLSGWMNRTLGRLARMTSDLRAYTLERKEKSNRSMLGEMLYKLCDSLTTRSVRLVATYSRQDEFEADAGAAEACGAASIRWALVHVERLSADLQRLPWNERLARLENDQESFSQWLVGALAQERVKPRSQMRDAVDAFSTHPSLRDRIRALGADDSVAIPGRPGIELLAEPDRVASKLVTAIHRTAAREERKDDYNLQEQIRKIQNPSHSNLWAVIGVAFIIFALLGSLATLAGSNDTSLFFLVVLGTLGLLLARKALNRDRRKLPIPAFPLIGRRIAAEEIGPLEKSLEAELRARFAESHTKVDVNGYLDTCYAALGEVDYLRAHVAARLALGKQPKNVDAALGLGIAAAALGNADQSAELHEWVRQFTGWRSDNVKWGVAWARCLLEDWATTEALLAQIVEKRADQATFQSVLGLAKIARGKIRTAEDHFRKAVALEPGNRFHTAQLASLFLDSGRLRDAMAIITPLRDVAETDVLVAALFLRLELLKRNETEAAKWAAIVEALDPDPYTYVKFGFMFESARFDDTARAYFERALGAGHYPEAHIGLARLQATAGDRTVARQHLLEALNAERELPATAQSPLVLLHDIIGQLNSLEEERVQCRAWIATVPLQAGGPLAGASMFVCAPEEMSAATHLERVLSALYPTAGMNAARLHWKEAPDETQPVRPIAPGVLHFTPANVRASRP